MTIKSFRGISPEDLHGRTGLRNPERGFRTEMYFSTIPGEVAGMCSCHFKQNKLDGRSEKPIYQNADIPGVPHLIRGNRLDGVEFSHSQWQDELDFLAYDGITVMQSYCFLNKYGDGQALPSEKLADIEYFFIKLREARVKTLLRFAYELSPTLSGPTAATTLKHLQQLTPLLRRYADVIYVLQCGFIGKFGEWHNSYHYLQSDRVFCRELMMAVLESLPPGRCAMMRTPAYKMRFCGIEPLEEKEAFTMSPRARIGHFNDGFLAANNHGGTFGGSMSQVSVEEEHVYLAAESRYLPMDGELFWNDVSGAVLPTEALKHLFKWHYDTFGMVHGHSLFEGDRYSVDIWKCVPVDPMFLLAHDMPLSDRYFEDDRGKHVWRSYYEYIRDHLGYRLELLQVELPERIIPGQKFAVKIKLVNRGFSAPVNPRPVKLVLTRGEHQMEFDFSTEIRRWYGHNTEQLLELECAVPEDAASGVYESGLWLPDESEELRRLPEYAIRLANNLEFRNGVNLFGLPVICD